MSDGQVCAGRPEGSPGQTCPFCLAELLVQDSLTALRPSAVGATSIGWLEWRENFDAVGPVMNVMMLALPANK